jgi:molybdate transport system regulatory protein
VINAVGGVRGGGAAVTAFGREIVAQFRSMEDKASSAIQGDLQRFSQRLRKPHPNARKR